ncbi:hypothetical protein GUJ93_ZPchr0002g23185 [Zizania palustris]|uniref:Uncharacterized protein n=1 Tax=Zizania palustris TaxID=103762 RepID=A0A8J5UXS5_ZIZPA|nr:hypothetical protein GUJ93_ZPchr0009g2392 [Zizania palustris]KAG8059522.1 hypothetical protein GUJ93_ZPchr0002g23185 [Zizania palustris]
MQRQSPLLLPLSSALVSWAPVSWSLASQAGDGQPGSQAGGGIEQAALLLLVVGLLRGRCGGGVPGGRRSQAGDEVCGWSSQAGDGQPGSQAGGGIEQAALLCGRRGEAGPPREKSPSAASCARALFVEKN